MKVLIPAGVLGLFVIGIGCTSCTRIGPGYVGIKVNLAGTDRGVAEYASTTGYVFTNPFTQTVLEYPTFVQNAVWRKWPEGDDHANEELTFNTKDYKLPKGITIDYDNGSGKDKDEKLEDKKGKVEIVYTGYVINKGVPDSVFTK